MKLVMTLLVRNEVDVIETNLEYHLAQGVDFVIVTDHGSEDGTSEILQEYEQMGVAQVIRDEGEGHHQSDRVTHMAEVARLEHGADWVIHNDADEFWWPLVGDLRDVFSSFPSRFGQIRVKRRNFRPRSSEQGPFYSRLVYREASSLNLSGEELEPKVAHRAHPDVVVAPGNHSIRDAGLLPVPVEEVLEIFHFPMRGYDQFEHKVVQIGHGYEQLPDRSPTVGDDQLALLELQRTGKLRDYYDELVLDEATLERELELGTIVLDRRLEHFICGVHAGERSHARSDAPFAKTMLERMMEAVDELDQARAERDALRSEHARAQELLEHERRRAKHTQEHVEHERRRADYEQRRADYWQRSSEQLQQQIVEMSASLARTAQELQSTSQSLQLLRSSLLMRSTAKARRFYYRATGKT